MSVFINVINAVVAQLSPASIIFSVQPDVVVKRKRPQRKQDDLEKLIVISGKVVGRLPSTAEDDDEATYEILITSIIPNNAASTPSGIPEQWREEIQRWYSTPGVLNFLVPEVSNIEINQRPTYNVTALEKFYDYTPTQLLVTTLENRVLTP